ncbi:MAG: methyl-accepting chemotaxis protein [Nitrospirae bacterium]|nr:methyl-accepting chemotaxis protein [Nitrospirota bacterium]
MKSLFEKFKIKYRLLFIAFIVFCGLFFLVSQSLVFLRGQLMEDKRIKTQHLVDAAYTVVEHYHKLSKEGKMPEDEAKLAAMNTVGSLRYDEKEYFWINDLNHIMLVHPKKDMVGKSWAEVKDPTGKKIVVEFVDTVKKSKAGFVAYSWQRNPDSKELIPKLSYVKGFEPWNWIVGTGIYIDDVDKIYRNTAVKFVSVAVVVMGLTLLIIWFINRSITGPLDHLAERVEVIANGDLTVTLQYAGKDEIGHLSSNMNKMIDALNTMIRGIMQSSDNVVGTVHVLKSRTEKSAEGARNQSSQSQQIAASAEEMSQTITDIAKNASIASDTSNEAMEMADSGKEMTELVLNKVDQLFTSTEELSSMVNGLNKRVSEIGDIATVIKDIADQTNLLALNAAIEAARAGEQGRGFAVVADEVRKLAERTIRATGEITGKISAVQQESAETAKTMARTSADVSESKEFISRAGQSLGIIVDSVKKVQDQITRIAVAVDEQSAASEDVARNIEQTSAIAKDMETVAGDVMAEVNKLTAVAEGLKSSTSGFRVQSNV